MSDIVRSDPSSSQSDEAAGADTPQGRPQEVEFALILARMIDDVQSDPQQMRNIVYEFARHRVQREMSSADWQDRKSTMAALETAIVGVERFNGGAASHPQLPRRETPALPAKVVIEKISSDRETPRMSTAGAGSGAKFDKKMRLRVAAFICAVVLGGVALKHANILRIPESIAQNETSKSVGLPATTDSRTQPELALAASPASTAAQPATQPDRQLFAPEIFAPSAPQAASASRALPAGLVWPSTYGFYALSEGKFVRLSPLPDYIPDKKVPISTPISTPSRTLLPEGRLKFLVFQRDMGISPPDTLDVRVFAKIARATSFDAKGKPVITPVEAQWSLRNISYEYRALPAAINSEMRMFESEKGEFSLAPGRYVVVLDGRGYDFTVAGSVADRNQCLERLDAANGSFFSECRSSPAE